MFSIGEKIVCINNKGAEELVKREIYTVEMIISDEDGNIGIVLTEFSEPDSDGYRNAYYHWRFRKMDHSFAEKILSEISESVKQEELIY